MLLLRHVLQFRVLLLETIKRMDEVLRNYVNYLMAIFFFKRKERIQLVTFMRKIAT